MIPPDLELTGATEAAAQATYEAYAARRLRAGEPASLVSSWVDLRATDKLYWRQEVLSAVTAALPFIARQVFDLAPAIIDATPYGEETMNPWAPESTDWDEALKKL